MSKVELKVLNPNTGTWILFARMPYLEYLKHSTRINSMANVKVEFYFEGEAAE